VLPVGGIKEKILAARAADVSEIYLPTRNRNDIEEIDSVLREPLTFHYVDHVDDVLRSVLCPPTDHPVVEGRADPSPPVGSPVN
jgi:ATP-dependent Lon protease